MKCSCCGEGEKPFWPDGPGWLCTPCFKYMEERKEREERRREEEVVVYTEYPFRKMD